MSNLLTETHDAIAKGIENVKGWIADVEGKLPAAVEAASKLENSPIVQALQNAVLPANVEAEIAKLITEAHNAFAEHGTVTVNASATPAPSDTASPADPTTPATTGDAPATPAA